jgi:hypothetical protein
VGKKIRKILLFLLLIFFAYPEVTYSAAPTISSPSTVNLDESFTIQASMSGLSKTSVYRLRIALSKPSISTYFGSTYNGADWYNGTPSPIDYSKYLSVTTEEDGSWSGDLMGKVESGDPKYENIGTSTYDLKIGRYTQNGSTATWSNIIQVTLNAIAPTPTPTPTPTSTPSNNPTSAKAPTQSPSLFVINTTKFPTNSPTKYASKSASLSAIPTSILGASNKSAENKTKSELNKKVLVNSANKRNITYAAITLGSILILTCGILVYLKIRKNRHV